MNQLKFIPMIIRFLFLISLLCVVTVHAQSVLPEKNQPSGLTVDFLAHAGQVFRNR